MAGDHGGDGEPLVVNIHLAADLEAGRIEEVENIGPEETDLAASVLPAKLRRYLASVAQRRLAIRSAVVDHVQRQLPAEPHGGALVVAAVGLGDDDVIGRLLDLDERDPRAQVVRDAAMRHEYVACADLGAVERVSDRGAVIPTHRIREPVPVYALAESDARVGRLTAIARSVKNDPCLGLAKARAQVALRPMSA